MSGMVTVPSGAVARQDLTLVDSAVSRGPARIRGRVVRQDGTAVAAGRVAIAALRRDEAVSEGTFTISDLPIGTWLVEAHSVGLEPQSALLEATGSAATVATIRLDGSPQPLHPVTVVGTAGRTRTILDDVMLRHRASSGTVFLPGDPSLDNAQHVVDALRAARGFRYVSPTDVYARGVCKEIAIYVNGVKLPLEIQLDGRAKRTQWDALDNAAAVKDVLAVEAYPDVAFAPVQWRTGDVCAVVAVWTK